MPGTNTLIIREIHEIVIELDKLQRELDSVNTSLALFDSPVRFIALFASAYVLVALPFFIAFAITLLNPTYMDPLYHSSTGHMLIFMGLGMMVFGSLILKKLVSFKG